MQRRKITIGFITLVLSAVIVAITSYLYWGLRLNFDASGLNHGDGKILVAELLGFELPPDTQTIQEKIKSGFGNDYGIEAIFLVSAKFSTPILSACEKYGLSKGGALQEVLAGTKMNITQLDGNRVLSQISKHESTCYKHQLFVGKGEMRASLVVLAGDFVFLLDSHT